MTRVALRLVVFAAMLFAALPGGAQIANGRPVRLVVPYPPGGTVDILARALADGMAPVLNQPIIVENRAGAGGTVAAAYVAQSAPDGTTLFVADVGPLAISRSVYKNLSYDSVRDFEPVALGTVSTLTVAVNPAVPVKTVRELIALAKAQPGKVNFSSSGVGSIIHTTGELFKMMAGVDMVHVPYKGGAPAVTAVMAGEVQVGFLQLPTTLALDQAGKVRLLAVTQGQRSRLAPDLPTVAESGVPDYDVSVWQGVVAPKGTPRETIDRLNKAIVAALGKPEIKARLTAQGFDVVPGTPEQFGALLRREADKWEKVVRSANIQPE